MTSLAVNGRPGSWIAEDFDELVDSPVIIAPDEPIPFEANGQEYFLVNVANTGLFDNDMSARDVRALVKETKGKELEGMEG